MSKQAVRPKKVLIRVVPTTFEIYRSLRESRLDDLKIHLRHAEGLCLRESDLTLKGATFPNSPSLSDEELQTLFKCMPALTSWAGEVRFYPRKISVSSIQSITNIIRRASASHLTVVVDTELSSEQTAMIQSLIAGCNSLKALSLRGKGIVGDNLIAQHRFDRLRDTSSGCLVIRSEAEPNTQIYMPACYDHEKPLMGKSAIFQGQ